MLSNRNEIRQIAVFRALQLGDILCSIPALRNLRLNFPAAHISYIGLPGSKSLIERFSTYFDEFIPFPGYPGLPEQDFDESEFKRFSEEIHHKYYDLILQMQGNGTIVNDMLAKLEPKNLAGFSIDEDELISNPLMMRYPNFEHESSRHLKLISALGLKVDDTEMEYPLFDDDYKRFEAQQFPLTEKYICIHPGSRAAWRQWPSSYFAQIADLCFVHGFQIVLTGTKDEAELAFNVSCEMRQKPFNLTGKTDLGTLGVLLKNSSGLVANCTGISHIAAGLKVKSVIISMDGEPERWAPTDRSIHYTIDWTKSPNFETVKQAVIHHLLLAVPNQAHQLPLADSDKG